MKRILAVLVLSSLVLLLAILIPKWMAGLKSEPKSTAATKVISEEAKVDAFLDETIPLIGGDDLLARDEQNGIVRSTWRLGYGVGANDFAQTLRRQAADKGIELEVVSEQSDDVSIHVYGERDVVHEILVVSAAHRIDAPGFTPDPTGRPHLALVFTGLGSTEGERIVQLPVPVTVSIHPFRPYSLAVAENAIHHWHEVLVDLTELEPTDTPLKAADALPFASGFRIDAWPKANVPNMPLGVLLHPMHAQIPQDTGSLIPLIAQDAGRLGLETAKSRALFHAQTNGVGVLTIPHDHPNIDMILEWVLQVEEEGYRLVLVSEARRLDEFRGPRVSDE